VSGSAATSDLAKLALAVLQTRAARDAQQSIKRLVRFALLQTIAALCVIAALGCALGALLIYATPVLGGAGALLAGAAVFAVIALAALGLARRAEKMRSRSPALGSAADAPLAAAANLLKQHTGLTLLAALLAGVFVGSER
jgi:hypothetical protein